MPWKNYHDDDDKDDDKKGEDDDNEEEDACCRALWLVIPSRPSCSRATIPLGRLRGSTWCTGHDEHEDDDDDNELRRLMIVQTMMIKRCMVT